MNSTLSPEQHAEKDELEQKIDKGLGSYVEIGLALNDLKVKKLHGGDFIEYATKRFELSKDMVYRQIRAALVAESIKNAGLPVPKNIEQAHTVYEHAKESSDEQIVLWKSAVESGKPLSGALIARLAGKAAPKSTGSKTTSSRNTTSTCGKDTSKKATASPSGPSTSIRLSDNGEQDVTPTSPELDAQACLDRARIELKTAEDALSHLDCDDCDEAFHSIWGGLDLLDIVLSPSKDAA